LFSQCLSVFVIIQNPCNRRNLWLALFPFPASASRNDTAALTLPVMPRALYHVQRMRGGAQSHLMFCDDDRFYVVKFRNNPQHVRVLANEMLANLLAAHVGLPVPEFEQVEVRQELIERTPELRFERVRGRVPCAAGRHFGSRLPVDASREPIYDFVPDQTLALLANRQAFAGMLVFDQWTCNADARQAVFFQARADATRYQALMIDQGFCFNDGEWSFPDSPLRGLYPRLVVYEGVTGWESFQPWLTRIREMHWNDAMGFAQRIPPAWYEGDDDALEGLLETLRRRRERLVELLEAVRRGSKNPFPNWGMVPGPRSQVPGLQ
jgi:hypothetical protein